MPITMRGIEGLREHEGQHLGWSDYIEVTQERINQFAAASGDNQWIHVDVERARRESPFGGPIAHGYLTLSLATLFVPQLIRVEGYKLGVNYGAEKVRFPAPVPAGAKLRGGASLDAVTEIAGGAQVQLTVTMECEGASKPACVATVVYRYYS